MSYRIVGQVLEADDPKRGRIEVGIASGARHDDEGDGPLLYITKYRSGQVGERSIGMSLTTAAQLAVLLAALAVSGSDPDRRRTR